MSDSRKENTSVPKRSDEDVAARHFNCSDDQRAIFEAGIKLGSIYHQYVGCPVNLDNVDVLEKAIEEGTRLQPFVDKVEVQIDRKRLKSAGERKGYKYVTLAGPMLSVQLKVRYGKAVAVCELRYVEDMDYPLMAIREVSTE
ncbi:MAG: dihydroneopterin aldolase family protein [Thermoplasmata archaeon]|nr:dihydroneopterin aldolase family protein [Thermoplasmata archaeon]